MQDNSFFVVMDIHSVKTGWHMMDEMHSDSYEKVLGLKGPCTHGPPGTELVYVFPNTCQMTQAHAGAWRYYYVSLFRIPLTNTNTNPNPNPNPNPHPKPC